MPKTFSSSLLFSLLLLLACSSDPTTNTEEAAASTAPNTEEISNPAPAANARVENTAPTELLINLENLRLRATPGEKGKEIGRLAKGTIVVEAGEISDFTTRLKLRGVQFDEPWIKVKTKEGLEGWVYGGGVNFSMDNPTALANKLMERRLQTLFKGLTPRIMSYRQQYHQVPTSTAFAANYREGNKLRDTLVSLIESKITVGDYKTLPDLFWLEEALPGYVAQLVAEGTLYYLFQDYGKLQDLAAQTKGREDDEYINLCMHVHSLDSVENFFPSWFLQTWDYGGSSLLGQGVHFRLLQEMGGISQNSKIFEPEILALKDKLVNDITWTENSYWEPMASIQKELDQILAASLPILNAEDVIALETRRKMFADPQANKIEVNQKSGL